MTERIKTPLIKNIAGTVLIKGLTVCLSFFSMPFYLNYFDSKPVLGVWFTILSVISWVLTFDLGIGNGLRNNLSEALVIHDKLKIKAIISSAYIVMGVVSCVIAITGCTVLRLLNWDSILNITGTVSNEALTKTVLIIFCGIILQLWLKMITPVLYAMQRNVLANALSVITNIIILFYIAFFKTGNTDTNLVRLAAVNALAVIAPLIFAAVYVFAIPLKESKPGIRYYSSSCAKRVLSLGGLFFIIQIGLLVFHSTDQVLISKLYNAGSVVDYQLYSKIFGVAPMILILFTQPVWSAVSHAYAENKSAWIRKTYKMLTAAAISGGICCFAVLPFLQTIFDLWLGADRMNINMHTAAVFAGFSFAEMLMVSATCIANGISQLKCQLILITAAAVLKIPLTLFLSAFIKSWDSVIIADSILLLPVVIIQPAVLIKHLKSC